jgi:hypothetical protein
MPDSFIVVKTKYGLFTSETLEGKELVTSATEHQCREMTHLYLKNLQEQKSCYTETTYSGSVGGKL